ncbi:hypothetical protein EAH77_16355 [Ewingella americana]|uniref:Inorganic pyrophosphatase domain-containing protein n=2 Tax=Ewingella americana TaxID=41202 RepID=A0A502GFR7_9GAMM|nr:hypothetical protein EAH77_16355 [Ewingella americana]
MQKRGDLRLVIPSDVNYDPEQLPRQTIKFAGFIINLEFPKGSMRRGVDRQGVAWSREMKCAYGEFASTLSVDGDPLDVYLGTNYACKEVYVMHMAQKNNWDNYDEDKVMLGFSSLQEAIDTFLECYSNEPRFLLAWSTYSLKEFGRQLPIKSNSKLVFTEDKKLAAALIKSR